MHLKTYIDCHQCFLPLCPLFEDPNNTVDSTIFVAIGADRLVKNFANSIKMGLLTNEAELFYVLSVPVLVLGGS